MARWDLTLSKRFSFLFLLCLLICLFAANISASPLDDSFIAGYATSVLEHEFNLKHPFIIVRDGAVILRSVDIQGIDHDKVISALKNIKGVSDVKILTEETKGIYPENAQISENEDTQEIELPKAHRLELLSKPLFAPLIADPRWPHFSASYQYYKNDKELESVGSTSFGETFVLHTGDAPFDGHWQLGIQASVFAVFDLDAQSKDLINADYWVGFPISYQTGDLSGLLRIFHQSSHLGDEYLLRNRIERVNLSYESVDLKLSYDINDYLRAYGGSGYIFNREPSSLKPWSTQIGFELKDRRAYLRGALRPVAGVDIKNWQENNWDADLSIRIGVQMEKAFAAKTQLMLEYFNGHSPNGQFYERPIESYGLGIHFYF